MNNNKTFNSINKLLLVFVFIVFNSCDSSMKNTDADVLIGKKINFMRHAVVLHNINKKQAVPDFNKAFKIVTYADLYCYPCWQSIMPWKNHIDDFKQYSNVAFICYVHALPDDFDEENIKTKLHFPVFLDTRKRFKIVNKLGNAPNRLTFLLNKENEIILVGPPFSKEMKQKYIDVITGDK